jgi:hypothetical protein
MKYACWTIFLVAWTFIIYGCAFGEFLEQQRLFMEQQRLQEELRLLEGIPSMPPATK